MILTVETNDISSAKMLATMLKRLDFVKAVSLEKNKKKDAKPLTAKDWTLPGRPATDDEIENMLAECEDSYNLTAKEAREKTMKDIAEWKKSK
ncbi:MAG: hypothetical protein A2033_08365 [Bacteroidetes bacterium GWA2_31_9]|nr:MAG: hypothetical protein A2033_08365 [Bacteroidetes bacterium GWA2_31_9]